MPERRRHVHDESKEASQLTSKETSELIRASAADVEASELIRASAADLEEAWHRRPAFGWDDASTAEMALVLGWANASTPEAASELLVDSSCYPMGQSELPAHRSGVM